MLPDPPPNPLRHLIKSLGLSPAGLAAVLGLDRAAVRAALAERPSSSVAAYLQMYDALGNTAAPKLERAAQPVQFSVRLDVVDALHSNRAFRRSLGLLEVPPTVGELRHLVRRLSRRRSLRSIVRRLGQSFIPTATGLASWRKSTVGKMLHGGAAEDPRPLVPGPEVMERWRRYVLAEITSAACPPDPGSIARYRYDQGREGDVVTYTSTRPMPACVADWTRAGLEAMGGRFGVTVIAAQ